MIGPLPNASGPRSEITSHEKQAAKKLVAAMGYGQSRSNIFKWTSYLKLLSDLREEVNTIPFAPISSPDTQSRVILATVVFGALASMLVVSVPALDSKLLTSIREGERSHSNTRQLTTGRFKAVGKWNYHATDECSYWIDLRILRPSCLPTLDYVTAAGHWQLYTRGAREWVAERGESSLVPADVPFAYV